VSSLDNPGVCVPKPLPDHLVVPAAKASCVLNPANAPLLRAGAPPLSPEHIAVLTAAYWGPAGVHLTVGFLESTPRDLADRILAHMNAWGESGNVRFSPTNTDPMVRITREREGYWSYLGNGILQIPKDQPTMCLQGFTMNTPESEYRRVVRHETGHTLGFPHEHMRQELVNLLDPQATIAWFARNVGWGPQMVQEQVLTPLDPASIRGTVADPNSIMCYQIAGECTRTRQPIPGGLDIDASDHAFNATLYPKPTTEGGGGPRRPMTADEIFKAIQGAF
jgi:hypothetical protein